MAQRANHIHDNAAASYLTLEAELLDAAEEVTPLPTVLIKLVLGYADLLGYRVLPRGPVQLESASAMPTSMQDFRSRDVRSLSFQGGGSLVLSAPLFRRFHRMRQRLAVNPPLAAEEHPNNQDAAELHAATFTPYDASLVPLTTLYDRDSAWHVEELLLGAHALTHDAQRGWIVGVETTLRRSLLVKIVTNKPGPPPFTRLHLRKFKYFRALPFGINLIADSSQPLVQEPTGSPEEVASLVTRGHEGDDRTTGITLIYARAVSSRTTCVTPPPAHDATTAAATLPSSSAAAAGDANDRCLVRNTKFLQVAPAARSLTRGDLLSAQGARAFFRRLGQCEFGLAQCREPVHPECSTSCCSAEHCAQVNGGEACVSHG